MRFTMPLDDQTKARCTLDDAEAFLDVVHRVTDPMTDDQFMAAIMESEISKPLSFLLIHAAELTLKGYMFSKGKGAFGHSLGELLERAKDVGFQPQAHFADFISLNAAPDQNVTTRYSAGKDLTVVDPRQGLFAISSQIAVVRAGLEPPTRAPQPA